MESTDTRPEPAGLNEDSQANVMGAFGLGLLVGALVGAATAILLAPQPGVETRAELGETAKKLQDRANGLAHEVKGSLEKLTTKMRPEPLPGTEQPQNADRLSPDGVRIL